MEKNRNDLDGIFDGKFEWIFLWEIEMNVLMEIENEKIYSWDRKGDNRMTRISFKW